VANSCAVSTSEDENESFFQAGLAKLRAGEREESTGKLLMDLMEVRADRVLLPYARRWIKLFPRVESAPRLVGKWLEKYESNDAMYLATSYAKTYPDVAALIFIVRALANLPKTSPKLFDAIEKRFASEPNSHVWSKLQAAQNPKEELDPLILRWLEINRYNSNIPVEVSFIALFSKASDVLNEILRWIEVNQDKAQDLWLVYTNMMRGRSQAHGDLVARVATTASQWLARNPEYRDAGRLHYEVLLNRKNLEQLQASKSWFLNHKKSVGSHMALAGILTACKFLSDEIEPELITCAKEILKSQAPQDRSAVLAGALVEVCADSETIQLARETLQEYCQPGWLHAVLLRVAPDDELISKAVEIHSRPGSRSPEVMLELLKIDSKNTPVRKAAQKWISENPDEKSSKELQSLLTN